MDVTCPRAHGVPVAGPQVVTLSPGPPKCPKGTLGHHHPPSVATALTAREPWQRQPERAPAAPRDPAGAAGPALAPHSRARPGGTCCSPDLAQSPSETRAGRPVRVPTECAPAHSFTGCHTVGTPLQRATPLNRTPPARVRHYVIPRPGTQPHPANRSDWLPVPPALGFQLCHWFESNAN